MAKMNELIVMYEGSAYGELEILREDFAAMLRAMDLEVVEDVNIPESENGANPEAVREFARKNEMLFVELLVGCVPFYYCVKGNAAENKIKGWFKQK